ncbi:uncharacterized protein LOC131166511 [Malania oleifera]|uniref:uncharacterized protein LOC131166511 n=1 Tax=Malania oleifera TaxID=397392 RepID=UPI0025AE48A2|nr:uncharacterized protein LOC131166511 [Malania oleifera]
MASSLDTSSSSSSLLPPLSASFVTQKEFNLFHTIDRELYTRLVLALGRDTGETMHVMALWLCLEGAGGGQLLVKKLLSVPHTLLYFLADEALVNLRCIETEYSFPTATELPLTQSLLTTDTAATISPRFFPDNRFAVLRGVTRIFDDAASPPCAVPQQIFTRRLNSCDWHRFTICMTSALNGSGTIFLTFSKGYPISEIEVRDFLHRVINFVISLYIWQEVTGEEQVLYARLVVHSPAVIEVALDGQSKAKFSIEGKHVWGRKYIRKRSKSP